MSDNWNAARKILELPTKVYEDFTITEKAPTSAFTFKTFKTGSFKNLC